MSESSETTNHHLPQQRLRDEIERLADQPSGIVDLGHALVQDPAQIDEQACAACQEALSEYIEAELNRQPIRRLFPSIARHIDVCPACGEAYVDLLEIALQAETDPLPIPAPMPALDLSFLPPLSLAERLRQLVEKLTEELLDHLYPEALDDLPALSREFFRRLKDLGPNPGLQPASTFVLGFGTDLSPALRSLVAAYNATETILYTLSSEELTEELGGPRRPRTVERQARSSVRATGLGRKDSRQWAEQYVGLAQAHATEFLALASQIAEDEGAD